MTIAETPAAFERIVPFAELDARTQGTVAVPGDEEYDALVSPWNVAIPVRPAAVVAAETDQDVVEAVRFAAEQRPAGDTAGHRTRPDGRARHRAARHDQTPRRGRRPPGGLGSGRGRREVAARRRSRRTLRSGAAVRIDHRRRHRRLHHWRWSRADGADLRAGDRQGARHRGRHRRRRPAPGHPHGAPRAVLRPSRRQGDAGHRHGDRVRPGAPADVLRRLVVVRRHGRGDRHRAVAGLVRRPSRARHHVLRAVPAAGHARCSPAARRPAHAVGALCVDRRCRGGGASLRRDP